MTTPQNNVDRLSRNFTSRPIVVTTDNTVNPGDLVIWDTTTSGSVPYNTARPCTSANLASSASNFLGLAVQGNAAVIYPGDADQPGVEVLVRGVVMLYTTAADTYYNGTAVTIGADSQTITSTSVGAKIIGYTLLDPPSNPRAATATPVPESVTGAAGLRIAVILAPQVAWAAAI